MASATDDAPAQQKLAPRHVHSRFIGGASSSASRCARSPRATRGGRGRHGGRLPPGPVTPVAGQSFSATLLYSLWASSRPFRRWHALKSLRTRMQTSTSETKRKSLVLRICVHFESILFWRPGSIWRNLAPEPTQSKLRALLSTRLFTQSSSVFALGSILL